VGEEDSTAAAEDFMEAVAEEGFTGAEVSTAEATLGMAADTTTADIVAATMEDGAITEEGFTGVEVSTPEATLGMAADTTTADIAAATMEDGAITEVAAVTAGATAEAEDIGAEDTVTDGDGGLASGGRIGVGGLASGGRIGVGDIRMATTTTRGITRPTLIIPTRTIRILITGATILHRQILTHRPSPTRTDPQDPGDPRHREAQPTRTKKIATSRPLCRVSRFSPLTG
jgi:hypothetical protein